MTKEINSNSFVEDAEPDFFYKTDFFNIPDLHINIYNIYAFPVAGPAVHNELPSHLRLLPRFPLTRSIAILKLCSLAEVGSEALVSCNL